MRSHVSSLLSSLAHCRVTNAVRAWCKRRLSREIRFVVLCVVSNRSLDSPAWNFLRMYTYPGSPAIR
jgi:hypothetical protein